MNNDTQSSPQTQPLLSVHERQQEAARNQSPNTQNQDRNRGQSGAIRQQGSNTQEGQYPINLQLEALASQIDGHPRDSRLHDAAQGGQQNFNPPLNQSAACVFPERPVLLILNDEPIDARPQNPNYHPPPFILHDKLGPFVIPTGPATINIERLLPYLDYLLIRLPKELEKFRYKLYLLWIWLYVPLTLTPVVSLYVSAYQGSDEDKYAASLIIIMSIIHWAAGIYQAHCVQNGLENKEGRKKEYISKALETMKYYLMGLIGMITIIFGCSSNGLLYTDVGSTVGIYYLVSLILEVMINYYAAMKIEKHLKKYERFQELVQDKLQNPEKTGIYYRNVYELLELISEKSFLYPIKQPPTEKKNPEEMLKLVNEGLEKIMNAVEKASHPAGISNT